MTAWIRQRDRRDQTPAGTEATASMPAVLLPEISHGASHGERGRAWAEDHCLVRVTLQTRRAEPQALPPSTLVFLVDVSGSMAPPDKLPLLKASLRFLVEQLRPQDQAAARKRTRPICGVAAAPSRQLILLRVQQPDYLGSVVWKLVNLSMVFMAVGLLLCANAAEITYNGRPAREWIEALHSPDVQVRRSATASLMTVAPGADAVIPALGEAVKDEDEVVRRTAVKALTTLGRFFPDAIPQLLHALESGDVQVRLEAVNGLKGIPVDFVAHGPLPVQLGCEGLPILVNVTKRDEDPSVRAAAVETIAHGFGGYWRRPDRCRLDPVTALIGALKDKEPQVRRSAVEALRTFGSESAVPALKDALQDPDQQIRQLVALALGVIQAKPGVTIPQVAEVLLHAQDEEIRRRALEVLRANSYFIRDATRFETTIQADREAFFSAMIPALSAADDYLRRMAGAAFLDLGAAAQPAVPALIAALEGGYADYETMVRALGRIGPAARPAVPALAEVLTTMNHYRREDAARALTAIGPDAVREASEILVSSLTKELSRQRMEGAVEGLLALDPKNAPTAVLPLARKLGGQDLDLRIGAANCLGKLGTTAIPALVSALQDKDWRVRQAAAEALGKIGDTAAIPALERAREDENEFVRGTATTYLGMLRPDDLSIPALTASLKTGDIAARRRAATALSRLGPAAGPAVPELAAALGDEDMLVRLTAVSTLRQLEKAALPAVPALVASLRAAPNPERSILADCVADIGKAARVVPEALVEAVKDRDFEVRRLALAALRRMGKDSVSAAPVVEGALLDRNPEVRIEAALYLAEIGRANQKAVSILLDAIESARNSVLEKRLWELCRGLSAIPLETPGMSAACLQLLQHPDIGVRRMVAERLGNSKGETGVAVAALRRALADPDAGTRATAANSLGRFGHLAAPDEAALERALLEDSAPEVRAAAAKALGQLEAGKGRAIPSLMRAMKDPDSGVRDSAATALGKLGHDAQGSVDLLVEAALMDSSEAVRMHAGSAIWQVDPQGGKATPALLEALRNDEARTVAMAALRKIEPGATRAVPALSSCLQDPVREVAMVCAQVLGMIGPAAKQAVPVLIEAMKTSSGTFLVSVIHALGAIGPAAGEAMPTLVDLTLASKDEDVRRAATTALWRLGPAGAAAVPRLLQGVADERRRLAASMALSAFDPSMTEVGPYLARALDDPNEQIRRYAAMSLERLESPPPEAVPALIRMLDRPELDYRIAVVRLLGKIGPAAQEAVPALSRLKNDQTDYIRKAVRQALAAITGESVSYSMPQKGASLPDGWRLPTDVELGQEWRTATYRHAAVWGDFDGDGVPDTALLAVATTAAKAAVIVLWGQPARGSVVLEQFDKNWLEQMGIDIADPGEYQTACGKGYGDCEPSEPTTVLLKHPGIDFFTHEGANTFFVYNPNTKTFRQFASD